MRRIISLAATALFATVAALAQSHWTLVTDQGQQIPVEHIDYILAADDDDTFAIVTTDGTVTAEVLSATFAPSASDISEVRADSQPLLQANGRVELSHLTPGETVSLLSADGTPVLRRVAEKSCLTIDLSPLEPGIYLLSTRRSTVKLHKH